MMVLNIHKEKVGAFLFLIFSIAYGMATFQIHQMFYAEDGAFNARTLPFALCVFGIVVSLAILVLPPVSGSDGMDNSFGAALKGLEWKNVFLLSVLMVFYGLTIQVLGFIISTTIFLMVGFRILGERRVKYLVLVSLPLVLGFWLIMTKLLEVYLAPGSLYFLLGGSQ